MKRLSKVILISLSVVLLLLLLGVGGLWVYIQSDSARGQMEAALGKALKVPVKFETIKFQPPSKLRASGIQTVDLSPGSTGQPKITAKSLHGTLALRPLLSGNFELSGVVLDSPVFEWPQNPEGRWVWPSPEKVKTEVDRAEKPKSEKPSDKTGKRSTVMVRGVQVRQGSVTLLNAAGQPVITASEVNTQFSEISEEQLVGAVQAGKLAWASKLEFENVRAKVRYADDALELDGFEGDAFLGTAKGSFKMDTRTEGQPFKAQVEVAGIDLNSVAMKYGWQSGEISGRLSGSADLQGRTDRIARLEGPGKVSVENGRFKKLELFEAIAFALDLGDLANLRPKEAIAQFNLRDEKVFIDSMTLATDNIRIDANGLARFDGKLAMDARLSVTERFASTLPDFARGSFTRLPEGKYGLDFKISGKTDKPKTDLAEKLIGSKVQDKVVDLLGGLFGSKPKKKDAVKSAPAEDRRNP